MSQAQTQTQATVTSQTATMQLLRALLASPPVPTSDRCVNCGGAHHIQRCPEVRGHLLRPARRGV